MEKIYYLKSRESFFIGILMIVFAIIAFVPFILILIIRSVFSFLGEFRRKAQEETSRYVPARLKNLYE